METSKILTDISVIIRSVGERSEQLCYHLLTREIPLEQIFFIKNISPFSLALKKSLELGIRENKKWTLCIDADVLLRKYAITELINEAEKLDERHLKITAHLIDKFSPETREVGFHLYQTKFLPGAIKYIPEEGVDLRPETYMLNQMRKIGYKYTIVPIVVGTHDFEQYYSDIFRKGFVHAHKWTHKLNTLLPFWRERSTYDKDYQVLLWGLAAGISISENIRVDKNKTPFELLKEKKITEKSGLEYIDSYDSQNLIDKKVLTAQVELLNELEKKKILFQKEDNSLRTIGLIRFLIFNVGWFIEKVGLKLMWITRN